MNNRVVLSIHRNQNSIFLTKVLTLIYIGSKVSIFKSSGEN